MYPTNGVYCNRIAWRKIVEFPTGNRSFFFTTTSFAYSWNVKICFAQSILIKFRSSLMNHITHAMFLKIYYKLYEYYEAAVFFVETLCKHDREDIYYVICRFISLIIRSKPRNPDFINDTIQTTFVYISHIIHLLKYRIPQCCALQFGESRNELRETMN